MLLLQPLPQPTLVLAWRVAFLASQPNAQPTATVCAHLADWTGGRYAILLDGSRCPLAYAWAVRAPPTFASASRCWHIFRPLAISFAAKALPHSNRLHALLAVAEQMHTQALAACQN